MYIYSYYYCLGIGVIIPSIPFRIQLGMYYCTFKLYQYETSYYII